MKKNSLLFFLTTIVVSSLLLSCNQPAKEQEPAEPVIGTPQTVSSDPSKMAPQLNILIKVTDQNGIAIRNANVTIDCAATGGLTDTLGFVTITEVDYDGGNNCECVNKVATATKSGFNNGTVTVTQCGNTQPFVIVMRPR
ncbi:MAG: hypothetical protein KIS94_13350 [Chitinophagales bacterium]|nr:hypothetical protein [Chitinophagales bacterium]